MTTKYPALEFFLTTLHLNFTSITTNSKVSSCYCLPKSYINKVKHYATGPSTD
uniref:Uncharacterized protein n=1 Tax=Arundo donax TaxID=35708 RepID=A0A0A9CL98_ARUDO